MFAPGNYNKIPLKRYDEGYLGENPDLVTGGVGWADSVDGAETRGTGGIHILRRPQHAPGGLPNASGSAGFGNLAGADCGVPIVR